MATLRRFGALLSRHRNHYLCTRHLSATSPLSGGYWNRDWQPGPLPKTPEERAAAAKKYGLRPEDYDVMDDGTQGDYPNLPLVSHDNRDPFADYDFPGLKRNFGEPFHHNYEIVGYDQWDHSVETHTSLTQRLIKFLAIVFGTLGIWYLTYDYPIFLPEMPKQYPFNDLHQERGGDPLNEPEIKHYTFEPADES